MGGKQLAPALLKGGKRFELDVQFVVLNAVAFQFFLGFVQLQQQGVGLFLGFFVQGLGFVEFGLQSGSGFVGVGGFGGGGFEFSGGFGGLLLCGFELVLGRCQGGLGLGQFGLGGGAGFVGIGHFGGLGLQVFLQGGQLGGGAGVCGFQLFLGFAEFGFGGGQGFVGVGGFGLGGFQLLGAFAELVLLGFGLLLGGFQLFLQACHLGGFGAAVGQGLVAGQQLAGVGGKAVGVGLAQGLNAGLQVAQQLLHLGVLVAQVLGQVLGQGAGVGQFARGLGFGAEAQGPALGHFLGEGLWLLLGLLAPHQQAAFGVAQRKAQHGLVFAGPLAEQLGGVAQVALAQQGLGGGVGQQHKAHAGVKAGPKVEQVQAVFVGPGPLGGVDVVQQQVGGQLLPHAAGLGVASGHHALVPAVQGDFGVAGQGFGGAQAQGLQGRKSGRQ